MDRSTTLERLETETFDLVVIGAGIIGARVAYEAARFGASVALIDAGDFGGATSSASSKLIHGGLRYLAMHDYGLVREAHHERRALLDRIAPHLVRPLRFVLPVYSRGLLDQAWIAAGLLTYSALAGFRHTQNRIVTPAEAARLVPELRTEGMSRAGVYEDAQTNDSRLVLATVAAAEAAGAVVVNHLAVAAIETVGGQVHSVLAGGVRIDARMLVNAAGPWVDRVRRLEDPSAEPMARLSKGVHVVVESPGTWAAAVTVPLPGGRGASAVPWEGMLLLGTTDTEFTDDPSGLAVTDEDVDTVMREAAIALPPDVLDRSRIRYTFAGLRVLPNVDGSTPRVPRDEVFHLGRAGMVSIAGGKLTTHRLIALRALRHLAPFARAPMTEEPLPGSGPLPDRPAELEPDIWAHLTRLYGDRADRVVALGAERMHPDGPDVSGQVVHAARSEWALTVEDVVRRRTTLEVRGLATREVRQKVAATLEAEGVLRPADGR